MASRGTDSLVTATSDNNGNPNATPRDDTTLIIAVAAAIGALFLLVLVLFIIFVLYYYKKGDPDDEETYHSRASSRPASRAGSRPGSRIGSRRGSIIRSASLQNSLHADGMFLPNRGWSQLFNSEEKSSNKQRSFTRSLDLPRRHKSRSSLLTSQTLNGPLENLARAKPLKPEDNSTDKQKTSTDSLFGSVKVSKRSHLLKPEETYTKKQPAFEWSPPGSVKLPRRNHSGNSTLKRWTSTESLSLPKRMKSRSTKTTTRMVNGSLDNLPRMEAKTTLMTSMMFSGSLSTLPRGNPNKGSTDNYEDIDRDFWHNSKGGEGTITHNPAFGKDDDFKPIDANLQRFDKEIQPEEDVDSGMADFSAVEDSSKEVDHEEDKNTDNQIRILDMSTWSSPPRSPVQNGHPSPFTISSEVSQQDRRDEDVPVNFTRANPLRSSTSDFYQSSTKNRNQSVVDFYENANPTILGYSMQFPADAYGTGRRLLWQKKSFDAK